MKKLTVLLLTLFIFVSLCGCTIQNAASADAATNDSDTKNSDVQSKLEDESEKESEKVLPKEMIRIEDTTPNDIILDHVLEHFFTNGNHIYYFPNPISKYIIVTYKDGTTQNVKDALIDGNITIFDLDKQNIKYHKEFRLSEENRGKRIEAIMYPPGDTQVNQQIEKVYFDGNTWFCFPSLMGDMIHVSFNDGTWKSIKEALYDGTATIADLDRFNIYYTTTPHSY